MVKIIFSIIMASIIMSNILAQIYRKADIPQSRNTEDLHTGNTEHNNLLFF